MRCDSCYIKETLFLIFLQAGRGSLQKVQLHKNRYLFKSLPYCLPFIVELYCGKLRYIYSLQSCEEENENPTTFTAETPTGDIFTRELLQGIAKTIARSLIEYRKSKKPEILTYVEQLFNKVHDRDGNT